MLIFLTTSIAVNLFPFTHILQTVHRYVFLIQQLIRHLMNNIETIYRRIIYWYKISICYYLSTYHIYLLNIFNVVCSQNKYQKKKLQSATF